MPKGKNKKYSKKQMKIARMAAPFDRITGADFKVLKRKKKKSMKQVILDALEKRYQAQISEADATIKIYFNNSVGIGEHPQHIDEVDKLIEKIANAEEKIKILKEFE